MRSHFISALLVIAGASASSFAASVQTTGHTDIRFIYDSGEAYLEYHVDSGSEVDGVELTEDAVFLPTELITYVPGPSVPRPVGAAWNFTGNAAGAPIWYIPFTQEVDRPWTGISTESVTSDDFSNIAYQLTAFNGPGQMSVADFGPFGDPNIFFQTSNGIDGSDVINVPAGTHAHYAWLFTEMGTYTFDLTVTGTLTPGAGGGTVSVTDTFTFQVVPAPGAAALLGVGGMLSMRRRRG